MLSYLASFIGTNQNTHYNWKKSIKNDISAIRIQSVMRGHFTRRIYSNLLSFNKNNKLEIYPFKSNKNDTTEGNQYLCFIEHEIDTFIINRNKYFTK